MANSKQQVANPYHIHLYVWLRISSPILRGTSTTPVEIVSSSLRVGLAFMPLKLTLTFGPHARQTFWPPRVQGNGRLTDTFAQQLRRNDGHAAVIQSGQRRRQ